MVFTIQKNKNNSNNFLYKFTEFLFYKKRLSYYVNFKSSVIYTDNTSMNCLFGYSKGYHKYNSANFGWEYNGNELHVYVYCFIRGKLIKKQIKTIIQDKEYLFTIFDKKTFYLFTIIDENDNIKQEKIEYHNNWLFGYKLWPFSTEKVSNTIVIDLIPN